MTKREAESLLAEYDRLKEAARVLYDLDRAADAEIRYAADCERDRDPRPPAFLSHADPDVRDRLHRRLSAVQTKILDRLARGE